MINIRDGTSVFVPWRIQGIVRNEDRLRKYSLHQLERQNKFLLNSISREQALASNRLDRFVAKFKNAPRTVTVLATQHDKMMGSHHLPPPPSRGKQLAPTTVVGGHNLTAAWRHPPTLSMAQAPPTPPAIPRQRNSQFLPTTQKSGQFLPTIAIPKAQPSKKTPLLFRTEVTTRRLMQRRVS